MFEMKKETQEIRRLNDELEELEHSLKDNKRNKREIREHQRVLAREINRISKMIYNVIDNDIKTWTWKN